MRQPLRIVSGLALVMGLGLLCTFPSCSEDPPPQPADLAPPGDLAMAPDLVMPLTCRDGVRDGDETDVDCGGACAPCATGQMCNLAADCQSTACTGGQCVAWRPIPELHGGQVDALA